MSTNNKAVILIAAALIISILVSAIHAKTDTERNELIIQQCILEVYLSKVDALGKTIYQADDPNDFVRCLKRKAYQHPETEEVTNKSKEDE